jgi:DNA-binding LacI/PurR family transcriptional regulator
VRLIPFPLIERSASQSATSIDVARRAGVSQSTVSLVLSGKAQGRVSEATQERVRQCARELSYVPNLAAQTLRLGTSGAVALIVPDVTNPFFGRVLRGAQRAAQAAGLTVALVDTGRGHWEEQSFASLLSGPVDGYLLFQVMPPPELERDHRIVLIEREAPAWPSVRFDIDAGAGAVFEHLLGLGHRRIGHLAADWDAPTFHAREEARRRVLAQAGIDPDEQPRAKTAIGVEDAHEAGRALLEQRPTAVFCDDDLIAAGLYMAARDAGLKIPDDLSVVGFDDMDFARVLGPPLTTVALDGEQLGDTAFGLLEGRLAGRRTRKRVVLPTELLVRDSTAPLGR